MKKKIAIIGASYLQLPLVLKAKEMGWETICFAWMDGAVARTVADKFYPISVTEKEKILEVCRTERIDAVATIASDVAVPIVAHLASNLNLIGNTPESAYISTNKYAMRKALSASDVNCPKFLKICALDNLPEKTAVLRFPLIVKPCDRSGSAGVTKVETTEELAAAVPVALALSLAHEAIIEEFVAGAEVSVETISWQGTHHILAITDKLTSGAPHFVELAHHQPSHHTAETQAEIRRQTVLALTTLGINNGASHSEFLIRDDGRVFVTEIGARMGGDFIGSDLVQLSTGYDFLKGVVEVACGTFSPPNVYSQRCSGVWFFSQKTPQVLDYIQRKTQHPEIVRAEIFSMELVELTKSADRSGYFIYQSDKRLEL
jgi:biotin carboxylase